MTSKTSSERLLKTIQSTLEEIRSIFILANQDKLKEAKKRLLRKGSVKEQVYSLCDGTKTTTDIAQAIQKDSAYVRSYLSILRREGLIRTVEREGKTVHEQVI
ncbi:MAG: hypothetical protein DRO00_08985 [Thermoproteota archaeon]|nr:MAG: hypothetical protein DRO00_08985 [Candidatus Korarchaeota archaeon]